MDVQIPSPGRLAASQTADVCVVGAGIAGLSVAYFLACEGADVVVLEDGAIGGGETARTTAHLSSVLDARYAELERLHGASHTRLIAESHAQAIARIESIVERESIDCDFRRVDGYLFAAVNSDRGALEREWEAATRAALADVEWVTRAPIFPFDTGRCLRVPHQAQFHPLRYLAGLAHAVERRRGRILRGHAIRITGGQPAYVETASGHSVTAKAVVVATNSPVNDLVTMHTKQAAYRTYVVAARLPSGAITPALYWDTADPYHYVRVHSATDHDLLIVGGEDHHTGQSTDGHTRFERLEAWARARFAPCGPVVHRWSGQIIASIDGLGFIGRNPGDADNVFIATGDSGNGMTHGTIAGVMLTDLVAGRPHPWTALYAPDRITTGAALTFTRESLHVAAGYAYWLAPGRLRSAEDLRPGCGAIFQRGLGKIAAYRDEHGRLFQCSATCPHLGGSVTWNEIEKSWDCPCHGSRFDATGHVINGPAIRDLDPES